MTFYLKQIWEQAEVVKALRQVCCGSSTGPKQDVKRDFSTTETWRRKNGCMGLWCCFLLQTRSVFSKCSSSTVHPCNAFPLKLGASQAVIEDETKKLQNLEAALRRDVMRNFRRQSVKVKTEVSPTFGLKDLELG